MQLVPSCFYHPVSVLFLDDNKTFLASLELGLGKYGNIITCTDQNKAAAMINASQEHINKNILRSLNKSEVDTATNYLVDLELNKLYKMIYNPWRFNYIAVLVVDYQMPPNMNGIEFCRGIKNKYLYKIMLTAEADKDTAIKAFNDGLIDKFLLKKNKNLYNELTKAIEQLKRRYFTDSSQIILESLGNEFQQLLASSNFQKLFHNIWVQSKAIEYYLIDSQGSFLFLDEKANPTWFILRNNKEFMEQIEIMEGLEASNYMINQLKSREKLLFMFSEEDYKRPIDAWASFLLNANKLDENYYFSIFEGKLTNAIDWQLVTSYR